MSRMFNPAHPGELIKEFLAGTSITDAAQALGVTRAALSRIINGHAAVSPDMALRLSEALDTTPEVWLNMQQQYDLWLLSQKPRPVIRRLVPQSA